MFDLNRDDIDSLSCSNLPEAPKPASGVNVAGTKLPTVHQRCMPDKLGCQLCGEKLANRCWQRRSADEAPEVALSCSRCPRLNGPSEVMNRHNPASDEKPAKPAKLIGYVASPPATFRAASSSASSPGIDLQTPAICAMLVDLGKLVIAQQAR